MAKKLLSNVGKPVPAPSLRDVNIDHLTTPQTAQATAVFHPALTKVQLRMQDSQGQKARQRDGEWRCSLVGPSLIQD